jgi:hypothetical protein
MEREFSLDRGKANEGDGRPVAAGSASNRCGFCEARCREAGGLPGRERQGAFSSG